MRHQSRITVRSLILGKRYIPSHTQYKRILLTGQLSAVAFIFCIAFLIFDLTSGIVGAWPYQLGCAIMAIVSFLLNRYGKYTAAKMLLGFSVNITVSIFSIMQPLQIGLYTFYIVCMLGAITAFGYEERGKATLFVLMSFFLILVPFSFDFSFMPRQEYTQQYVNINIIANFWGASIASALIIYFLINVNHHSEAALKENERQIREKNENLTKLNTELDRFVYSTSHDLRAPLSSIQGLIQLTKMSNDIEEIRQYNAIMEGRLKSLTKFIGDISDYSRNTRMDVNHQLIPVHKMVRDILDNLKFYPNSEKITVILDIPETVEIHSDPIRLQIILGNLISNSFKYIDLRKTDPYIHIGCEALDSHTKFRIEDNGIGIPENYREKIFDMFFQAHEKSEGSGLGLYIVKEAVTKLGGTIAVTSTEKKGCTFDIHLPALATA